MVSNFDAHWDGEWTTGVMFVWIFIFCLSCFLQIITLHSSNLFGKARQTFQFQATN